jgi:hypothetical protein
MDQPLLQACWCMHRTKLVPADNVWNGIGWSCDRSVDCIEGCEEDAGSHRSKRVKRVEEHWKREQERLAAEQQADEERILQRKSR